jgi:hypothetical protein
LKFRHFAQNLTVKGLAGMSLAEPSDEEADLATRRRQPSQNSPMRLEEEQGSPDLLGQSFASCRPKIN